MHHTLYFNRCFTTTSKLIENMLHNDNGDTFDIKMSHSMPNHYLERLTSHYELEPENLTDSQYVDYVLHNCVLHHANYLIPRHRVTALAEKKEQLELLCGTIGMFVASPDIYRLIDNKVETYRDLAPTGIVGIPMTFVIKTYEEFVKAYQQLTANGDKACLKPISGIGGEGFKRILEMDETKEAFTTSATALSRSRLERVLQTKALSEPFMMSTFMEGDEYSIDCLAKDGELFVALPRRKVDAYRQVIEYRDELIEIAQKITRRYNLSYLFNIQVKYHNGIPYLVEINTRFSGGLYKSAATGANMLYWAFQLLHGEEPRIPMLRWNIQIFDTLGYDILPLN